MGLGPYFFDNDQTGKDLAALLCQKGGNRTYLFRCDAMTKPKLYYGFSHAECDSDWLIIEEGDLVTCLGRGEDGEWQDLDQVHGHKHMIGNIAARLQEHLI